MCVVIATNARGSVNASAPATAAVTSAPIRTALPVVSGSTTVGSVLSCTTGTWIGTATITYQYQWQRAGVNISGATSSTYTAVSADLGSAIRCFVTASNGIGSVSSASSNSITIALPAYPTVSAANEVFKFNYNTLAVSPDLVAEISSHAWPAGQSPGSGGYASLSQPSGGAYSGGGYYWRNDGTNDNAWITALSCTNYTTYHNTNVAQASWAYETNIWIEDAASYNISTNINLIGLYLGGITIAQQYNSSTAYRIFVNFATGINSGSATGAQVQCNNLTGGGWKHLVVQVARTSSGVGKIYCFVDGILQNSGGTDYNVGAGSDWWCSTNNIYLGNTFSTATPKLGFRLDNTRLILGNPFSTGGFTAPTSAFTA
jgi:hypothetical protein